MNYKIVFHYAIYFFIAALFLIVINIIYMQNTVYQNEELYHFDPNTYFSEIESKLELNANKEITAPSKLKDFLEDKRISIQILNTNYEEKYRLINDIKILKKKYTPENLINLYQSDKVTSFIKDIEINGKTYSLLMFLNPENVKRRLYTYDVDLVETAYNPLWLVIMNLILLIIISYIYSYRISRPMNNIIKRILKLSNGDYKNKQTSKGIYRNVDIAMNKLAKKLEFAKQERKMSDITREEWITNLSHDIKTPLTSIIGYGELLADYTYNLTSEDKNKYKKIIKEKGSYIEDLLEDLNMATKLKHNQLPINFEEVELVSELKNILIDFLNTNNSKNNISFNHENKKIFTKIDKRLFKRVIINLVSNAFKHNDKPVNLKMNLEVTKNNLIKIIIEDDGEGVDNQELSKIFNRYYRGTNTKANKKGSGLGLAIAKDIIEAHKGTVEIEKSSLGGLKIVIKLLSI